MQFGVVVPAAQPVHPRLVVVDVAAVAERIRVAQGVRQLTRAAQLCAPCAVLVFYHNRAVRVKALWHEKRPASEGGAESKYSFVLCVLFPQCSNNQQYTSNYLSTSSDD